MGFHLAWRVVMPMPRRAPTLTWVVLTGRPMEERVEEIRDLAVIVRTWFARIGGRHRLPKFGDLDQVGTKGMEPLSAELGFDHLISLLSCAAQNAFQLLPFTSQADDSVAAIGFVDFASDVTALLEVAQEVIDGLFGKVDLAGKSGRTGAIECGVSKKGYVRAGQVRIAGCSCRFCNVGADPLPTEPEQCSRPRARRGSCISARTTHIDI